METTQDAIQPGTDESSSADVLLGQLDSSRSADERALHAIISLCVDLYWQQDAQGVCTAIHCHNHQLNKVAQTFMNNVLVTFRAQASVDDWDYYQECIRVKRPFRQLHCQFVIDGEIWHLKVSGIPQYDVNKTFLGFDCTATNTTNEHIRESRLKRFRAAMDMSMDMIYLVDRETLTFLDVNDTACRNTGLTREQVLARGPAKTLAFSEEELITRYDRLIKEGGSSRIERRIELQNKQSVIIEVFSRATCIDGRWIIIGVSRDISDRKNAEMRAIHLQQMFSALSLTNEAILRAKSVQALYRNACTAAVSCELFIIATILVPGESGFFRALGNAGNADLNVERIKVSSDPDRPDGRGLAGECFRNRRPAISNDYMSDPRLAPWHEISATQGIKSAAALPLFRRAECVGVIILYAANKNAFDAEIMTILESMAENISFGLNSFANAEDQAQASALLKENEERFRSLTQLSSDFYWEQDASLRFTKYEGRVVGDSNKRAVSQLIGKHLWELPGVKPDSHNWRQLRQLLKKEQQFRDFEFSYTNDENQHYHFSLSGVPFFDSQGKFKGYRGISRDISDKKRVELRIKHLATHDTLTGLPNRTMFSEMLQQAIRFARRYKDQGFAVLFIDLDRFKSVNDTYGHHIGDRLLTEVASRLKNPLRRSDIVARLGGDEFVVLLQKVNSQELACQVARNILNTFNQPIALDEREFMISGSIGISLFGEDADNEDALMTHADTAMYAAKEDGRNSFRCYSSDLHQHTQEKANLALQLRHALARGELTLYYQAKLELISGRVTGVETLLRWHHPELGDVSPSQFIPIAEDNGLILPISDWVMKTACQQMVSWQQQHDIPTLSLAVNLSPRQFNHPDLEKRIREILAETGLKPELLELEITESLVAQNPERAISLMRDIKRMGVRFALDDFGTGYSSLGQLRHYPLNTLKIDRAFIKDLDTSKEDQAISKAILSMGKTLGLTVVAEGVETSRQIDFLRQYHCDEIQGFFCHKPCNAEQFITWLRLHQQPFQLGLANIKRVDKQ